MNQKTTTVEQAWFEYQKRLSSFIRSKVEISEDAEEILNEVFANLTKETRENDIPNHLASWLYRVTRNRIVDYYRSKKRFEPLPETLSVESEDTKNDSGDEFSACCISLIINNSSEDEVACCVPKDSEVTECCTKI